MEEKVSKDFTENLVVGAQQISHKDAGKTASRETEEKTNDSEGYIGVHKQEIWKELLSKLHSEVDEMT